MMSDIISSPNPIEESGSKSEQAQDREGENKPLAESQQLTKKERRFLKRQEKKEEQFRYNRQKKTKKILRIVIVLLVIMGGTFLTFLFLIK